MAEKKEKQYVNDNARLMAEWDWKKNEELGFNPQTLTIGSGIKVWWLCSKNHSYLASLSHKSQGRGCPFCARKKVLFGFNDLSTLYPSIAKEWNLYKNHPLKPSEVVSGTHKIVWWTCPKNHDYQMSVLDRTQGLNCPICSSRRIVEGINDLATTHPQLLNEWNWEKNNVLGAFPNHIPHASNKKVWWKCNTCQYEWMTSPNNRSRGTNCPVCANRIIISGKNDLLTKYPLIAKRWHPTLNEIAPSQVAPNSNQKAYWTCEKDNRHYFYTRIDHMVNSNIACPVCANQSIIVGINDLTTTHPQLIEEWDFQKNTKYKPQDFTYGNTQKVWWKCKKGHSWQSTIASRTTQKCGCPTCSKELRVSFPETIIAHYLSKVFQVERSKHFHWLNSSEIDVYLPQFSLGIEYDGGMWHKNVFRDKNKDEI